MATTVYDPAFPTRYAPGYQETVKHLAPTPQEQEFLRKAFNSPSVFKLLSTIRSRRFGMGYRYETGEPETRTWSDGKTVVQEKGPLAFKSERSAPLSELEEAMIAWAALGPNGVVLADAPLNGNLSTWVCWSGRTVPAPCNDCAQDLFIVNDEGTWLYRPSGERIAPVELKGEEDYWKILKWYREDRVKISDRRPDIGWGMGPAGTSVNMMGPWQYNLNRPGSTWFIPVGDVGFEHINVLLSMYEWWHMYLTDPETGEPAGCGEWVKPGYLEMGVPAPMYDELLVMVHANVVGCIVQNIRLASEALGLGAWVFCGYVDEALLGAFPDIAHGLGFQYMQRPENKNPNKIATSLGLPGIKEAVVVPSPQFPTAEEVVDYVMNIRYTPGSHFAREDNYALRNKGPYKPDVMEQILDHPRIQVADWVRDSVVATVKYMVDKYGCVPTYTNPIQANFSAQIHHIDLDFYRKYQTPEEGGEPYMVTNQILGHFKDFHPDQKDEYERTPDAQLPRETGNGHGTGA